MQADKMRILVVGAGAIGGYFGGRLVQAGQDVTFLVRAPRAAQLEQAGLVIKSPAGDATLKPVQTVQADTLKQTYDLILLSCKAYDLDDAVRAFAPAVGPGTLILPLLNGMSHLDALDQRFGAERVLGGQCVIAATLNAEREIVHLAASPSLTFGARDSAAQARVDAIAEVLGSGGYTVRASTDITQAMWEKWVFLATLAGSTSLFRAPVGDILAAPEGRQAILALMAECQGIAAAYKHAPSEAHVAGMHAQFLAEGSPFTSSMMRDIENNARIEADHIVGDLIRRADAAGLTAAHTTMLRLAYTHLKTYEARRARTAG